MGSMGLPPLKIRRSPGQLLRRQGAGRQQGPESLVLGGHGPEVRARERRAEDQAEEHTAEEDGEDEEPGGHVRSPPPGSGRRPGRRPRARGPNWQRPGRRARPVARQPTSAMMRPTTIPYTIASPMKVTGVPLRAGSRAGRARRGPTALRWSCSRPDPPLDRAPGAHQAVGAQDGGGQLAHHRPPRPSASSHRAKVPTPNASTAAAPARTRAHATAAHVKPTDRAARTRRTRHRRRSTARRALPVSAPTDRP